MVKTRITRKKLKSQSLKIAGAPKQPYDKLGNLNPMWVKEKGNSHATFVVDPMGTGTYCHVTINYKGDTTSYHYGYEVRNPRHRALGKHYWTTPYKDEHKLTIAIRNKLANLFRELCDDGSDSDMGSSSSSTLVLAPTSSSSSSSSTRNQNKKTSAKKSPKNTTQKRRRKNRSSRPTSSTSKSSEKSSSKSSVDSSSSA